MGFSLSDPKLRRPLFVILIGAAVLLLAVVSLAFLIDADQFRPAVESELTRTLGRQVKIGSLKLSVLSGKVTADNLTVADDASFGQAPFLSAKSLDLSIDVLPLLIAHKLNVNKITIDAPAAVLIQAPSGKWNFSSLGANSSSQPSGAKSEKLVISLKSMQISGARLSLTQGGGSPEILENVGIQAKNFAPGSVFPFTLSATLAGGGTIALDGKAGPVDSADAANTPLNASLKVTNLNLVASGAVPTSSGIEGIISADGNATSNGQVLTVTAKVTAERLKLVTGGAPARKPLTFDAAFTEDLKDHSGQLTRGDIAIGAAKGSLTGTWTGQDGAPVVKMTLSAPGVPVSGVEDLLPALGVILPSGSTLEGGTASGQLALSGPVAGIIVSGPVTVQNTRLKGFDLGAKLSPIEKLAGIKSGPDTAIQTLSANLQITTQRTSLQNIRVTMPSVADLTGGGTISPTHALNFKMMASVRANAVVSSLAPPNIPFTIAGTSSDPQFRPDVGKLASEEITRGLSGMKVGGVDAGKTATGTLQGLFGKK